MKKLFALGLFGLIALVVIGPGKVPQQVEPVTPAANANVLPQVGDRVLFHRLAVACLVKEYIGTTVDACPAVKAQHQGTIRKIDLMPRDPRPFYCIELYDGQLCMWTYGHDNFTVIKKENQ